MSNDTTPKSSRRTALLVGIPLLALGGLATVAVAAPGPMADNGPDSWRGGHHGHHAEVLNVQELREHMDMGADFLFSQVDATDAQEAEIDAILDEVAPAAFELKVEGRQLRDEVRGSLAQGNVDAEALESARQDGLDLADRASALALDAFVDISQVLTQAQRLELAELHERWRH